MQRECQLADWCWSLAGPRCRHPGATKARDAFWSNNVAVDRLQGTHAARVAKYEAKLHYGLDGGQGSWGVFSSRASPPGYGVKRVCAAQLLEQGLDVLVIKDQQGSVPSIDVYRSLLKACTERKSLSQAKRVHAHLARHGLESTRFLGEYVVSTLVKCGGLDEALQVFHRLPHRTVFSWTAVMSGYTMRGQGLDALRMYDYMRKAGLEPNKYTFLTLLKACGSIADLEEGKRIHAEALKFKCGEDLFVRTCLVDMYGKCGSVEDAQYVFDTLTEGDVVSWNVMLTAYAQQGQPERTLHLYGNMLEQGVNPDTRTFVSALQACGLLAEEEDGVVLDGQSTKLRALFKGRAIHADAWSKGFDLDVYVGSTLISFYGKCGSIEEAWNVFNGLSDRNVVSWTAMLAAHAEQGQAEKVLKLFELMHEKGVSPDDRSYVCALQACGLISENEDSTLVEGRPTKVTALVKGRVIHADTRTKGYDADVFVGNTIISMYGKCGSINDAENVFNRLSQLNIVSWNAMLAAYAQQGHAEKALWLYEHMQEEGVSANGRTFASVFQACSLVADKEEPALVDGQSIKCKSLQKGKAIHADARIKGYDSDVFVCSTLISMYAGCGNIGDAQIVFGGMSQPDVLSWNALLAAYIEQGEAGTALQLYEQMSQGYVSPNAWTFVSVVQACGIMAEKESCSLAGKASNMKSFEIGKAIHGDIQKKGLDTDVFVGSTLISMYGKCQSILDAQEVFDRLNERNVVSWNAMLAAYVELGQAEKALEVYDQMQKESVPNERTFSSALQACGILADMEKNVSRHRRQSSTARSLDKGRAIHADVQRKGHDSDVFVGSTLISMYGRCGSIIDAWNVFNGLFQRDLVSWNTMLTALVEHGQAEKALQLYDRMKEEGVSRDDRTFVSGLQACGMLAEQDNGIVVDGQSRKVQNAERGRAIHAEARRKGYESHVFVSSTLISMYGKSGSITDAQKIFDALSHRDVVVWSAMLGAYVEVGQAEAALQLYEQMQEEDVKPDACTFVSAFQACAMLAEEEEDVFVNGQSTKVRSLEVGKAIHDEARRKGLDSDGFVGNTLISMYGKCGSISNARRVFDCLSNRGVVAWTAMLGAYSEQGQVEKALHLYRQMQQQGPSPNEITLLCILQGSSKTGSLTILREIHQTVIPSINDLSPLLASALISAYGKCASMVDAQAVFDKQFKPDLVSWNALVAAYARQGCSEESLECYEKMQLGGVKPNGLTFLSLLSACSHAGLVDRGIVYFESMTKEHGLSPQIEHYVCMIDLLGRAGLFSRVEDLLSTMPMQPSLSIWLCLLGACRKHGKVALGERAFNCAVSIEPKHAAAYVLMINIYADAGHLDRAEGVANLRQEEGAWKKPGQTWIDHNQEVHSFVVGDRNNRQYEHVYDLLMRTTLRITKEGHIHDGVEERALSVLAKAL